MENETLRTRLAQLLQKSRKASRLYSSIDRVNQSEGGSFSEVQVREWKSVNLELLKQLTMILEVANNKKLVGDLFLLRDRFYGDWRRAESESHGKQRELVAAAENGDFVKAATLSNELIVLKARLQAAQAVHHELEDLIKKSRLSVPAAELPEDYGSRSQAPVRKAQVIPLRRKVIN